MTGDPRVFAYAGYDPGIGMNSTDEVDFYTKAMSGQAKVLVRMDAKQALRMKPDAENIVDIGTGPGFFAIEMAKLSGRKVTAVDLAPNMLKRR